MRYSIILPVYNAQSTLRRCLDSIVNQPFSDYELLLINDGSTDESDGICREYAAACPQIRYFSKENGGVSSARNMALEQASGEYILFVDSDDYIAENYFSAIHESIRKYAPDLLMFGYRNFGGADSEWDNGAFCENTETGIAERVSSAMRQYLFSSLWSKVFRRQIVERWNIRFKEDLSIGEDQVFIFTYAMHIQSITSIKDRLYNVDVSDRNSLSRKARPYLTDQLIEVNRQMRCALHNAPYSPKTRGIYDAALAWMSYRSAYSCCKELLKYDYTAKRRRQEISKICRLYREEKIRPRDWKCRIIALPVQLGLCGVIDWLILRKA